MFLSKIINIQDKLTDIESERKLLMLFRLKLMLSFFIVTIFCSAVIAQDAPSSAASPREEIIIAPTSIEPLYSPLEFRFAEEGRNWSQQDLQTQNIRRSFNTWVGCFQSTTPECVACNTPRSDDPHVIVLSSGLGNRCLPPSRDASVAFYPKLLPAQKERRDNLICRCFDNGEAGPIENYSFSQGVRNRASRGRVWERERVLRENATQDRVQNRLMTERFATGFSAASYLNNPADALALASRYSARGAPGDSTSARAGQRGQGGRPQRGGEGFTRVSFGQSDPSQAERSQFAQDTSEKAELSRELFNGTNLPENYCIPYRNFLASKQFPVNAAFYRDLDTLTSFNPRDWDYMALLDELNTLQNQNGGYPQVLDRSPRAKAINFRLRYLHNNPAIKNIFLSQGNDQLKRDMFDKIKAIPRPQCGPESCTRDANWVAQTQQYRTMMTDFMSRQNVIDAARGGSQYSRELQIMLAEDEARMISGSADRLIPDGEYYNPAQWTTFCDARRTDQARRTTGSTEFLQTVFEEFGNRDFRDYTQDTEYARTNNEVCQTPRRGPQGEKTFIQYFNDICGTSRTGNCSEENRPLMVSQFMNQYAASGTQTATAASLLPFINGSFNLAPATQKEIDDFNRIAASPELARQPISFSGGEYVSLNNSRGDIRPLSSREAAIARTEPTNRPTSGQNPQYQSPTAGFVPPSPENPVIVPQAQPILQPQAVAEKRAQLSEGESRAREISDELTNLRTMLRKETTSPTPDSAAISGLNQKISEWERKFRDQTSENQRLQDQIASAERAAASRRSQVADTDPQTNVTRRPASVPESVAAPVAAPQSGSNGGVTNLPSFTSGGSRGGSSGGTIPSGSRVTSRDSGGELSRFGVENTTERNGITVADASSTIDYNRLRTESAGSVLPITVSPEEFGQFSSNVEEAISRYVDRVRAMPGQVVRVDLQNGSQSMEIFVVKTGNQISVVQAPTGKPQRLPAAAVAPVTDEREFTLQSLQNEFTR